MARSPFSRARVIVFDFDGTIADSLPLHERAFNRVIADEMPDSAPSFRYADHTGRETTAVFRSLGAGGEEAARLAALKRRGYEQLVEAGELRFMPGARRGLECFAGLPCRRFVGTSGSRGSVSRAMAALELDGWFEGVVTASDVEHGKPAPDIFLKLAADYGFSAADAIVIEDAASGVQAARAAGMAVVGVYNEALRDIADACFGSLDAAAEFLVREIGGRTAA
jgi:beta-phosphoglucomutase-like phosphatase (HAD superfamily)